MKYTGLLYLLLFSTGCSSAKYTAENKNSGINELYKMVWNDPQSERLGTIYGGETRHLILNDSTAFYIVSSEFSKIDNRKQLRIMQYGKNGVFTGIVDSKLNGIQKEDKNDMVISDKNPLKLLGVRNLSKKELNDWNAKYKLLRRKTINILRNKK